MAVDAKVGQWRLRRPVLDAAKCDGCLACWIFCPDSAVERTETAVSFNLSLCKGCGICARECPQSAIQMMEEADGA